MNREQDSSQLTPILGDPALSASSSSSAAQNHPSHMKPSNSDLANQRITLFCLKCAFIVALTPLQFGYKMSELNIIKDSIVECSSDTSKDFHWSLPRCLPMADSVFAFATSVFALAGLFGSLLAGYLCDRFGRKRSLFITQLILFVGVTIQTFSLSPAILVVGRFVSGFGSGVCLVAAPMYLTEIAPPKRRGALNLLTQFGIVIGVVLGMIMGYFFRVGNRWRMVFFIAMAICIVNFFLLFFIVESPKYLHHLGRESDAIAVLKRLRQVDEVSEEFDSWNTTETPVQTNSPSFSQGASSSAQSITTPTGSPKIGSPNSAQKKINIFNIFRIRKYRQPLFLVFALMAGQQLTGVNAVTFYSNSIFQKYYSDKTSSILTIIFGVVNAISTVPPIFLVERVGRRFLLLFSSIMMFICLILLCIGVLKNNPALSVTGVFSSVSAFEFGLGPLPLLLSTELFDTKAVATGNSFTLSINWTFTFVVGVTFFSLQHAIGDYIFVLYASFLFVFTLIYFFLLPETKHKTFEEVSREFVF
ncbi:hypothetical protein BB560_002059 [Smittium megazygosporum]|uniref:Major facilitator superfamily (MFS) profile domain-containing protein n=1 Tax=Smittium megazygosporum TaxID=133381 RepID=A0A2T9ZFV7_9FUNG|nr:hypothetical protein BB560_002059 [Smittium megazygosporum]